MKKIIYACAIVAVCFSSCTTRVVDYRDVYEEVQDAFIIPKEEALATLDGFVKTLLENLYYFGAEYDDNNWFLKTITYSNPNN